MMLVKLGGSVICGGGLDNVTNDVEPGTVLIHGGGCMVNSIMERMGVKPVILKHPNGYTSRYTDEETLKAYVMTMMFINKLIVSKLNARGIRAIGLSGVDLGLVTAKRKEKVMVIDERGRTRVIDGGFSGRVTGVNVNLMNLMLSNSDVVVVSPIAISQEGLMLNVDGDQIAENMAISMNVKELVILTNVDGVLVNGKPVDKVTKANAQQILQYATGGMRRKLETALKLSELGVKTIIANGLRDKPIRSALNGVGTVIE
ncbi:[LysW]-aminoadipate/[LysW]-glutamate kinase [Caldivirga sp.]|jgi:acetylglutamate/LysW-gamma-L-alpha-aminoadipate kinase|uniref:[LysW]-aminoadipate/[LysW]-glutamate kinase n=1 Tax=Caldivirga sp. TaxID=2080243 RepID=UPI003D0C3489